MNRIHCFAEATIFERERFAITADIWCSTRDYLAGFEPLCLKKNPHALDAARYIWALARRFDAVVLIDGSRPVHLIVSMIFTGFFNRSLCDCHGCLSIDLNAMPMEWKP